MSNVAVVGDSASVMGFRSLGVEAHVVEEEAVDLAETWKKIVAAGYEIVYVTEAVLAELRGEPGTAGGPSDPAIIPLPPAAGPTGLAEERIMKMVEKALGTRSLFDRESR